MNKSILFFALPNPGIELTEKDKLFMIQKNSFSQNISIETVVTFI